MHVEARPEEQTMAVGLSLREMDLLWWTLRGDDIPPSDEFVRRKLITRLADLRSALASQIDHRQKELEERERDRAARGY